MHDIQRKAEDTELLVTEICRDIRKLDYAKRHLTHTITSLRRLAMLTAAVDDLEQARNAVMGEGRMGWRAEGLGVGVGSVPMKLCVAALPSHLPVRLCLAPGGALENGCGARTNAHRWPIVATSTSVAPTCWRRWGSSWSTLQSTATFQRYRCAHAHLPGSPHSVRRTRGSPTDPVWNTPACFGL